MTRLQIQEIIFGTAAFAMLVPLWVLLWVALP